jgi:hypothetical protein
MRIVMLSCGNITGDSMIQEFLMELITVARASETPEHIEYIVWLAFVIGNVLMFVPSFNWPNLPKETDEEWYARICKQRDEQPWWSWS